MAHQTVGGSWGAAVNGGKGPGNAGKMAANGGRVAANGSKMAANGKVAPGTKAGAAGSRPVGAGPPKAAGTGPPKRMNATQVRQQVPVPVPVPMPAPAPKPHFAFGKLLLYERVVGSTADILFLQMRMKGTRRDRRRTRAVVRNLRYRSCHCSLKLLGRPVTPLRKDIGQSSTEIFARSSRTGLSNQAIRYLFIAFLYCSVLYLFEALFSRISSA